jgi:hypothetical protein
VLLSINYSASKANVVSVPIGDTGLSVTLQTGTDAQGLQNLYNNPNATSVGSQLGDDGNAHVPLNFTFPYWGKNFTDSWMHSNGVVSFQNPNNTGNFCCAGQDLKSATNSQYNYAIFPLWTDLIVRSGSAYYMGTPTSMTYGWYGTSEYGNSNAKNTFEVKIDNSGGLDLRWSGALITMQPNTIGFTGDLSKGEYFQAHNASSLTINNATQLTIAGTSVDPCIANPLYSTTCAGYKEAYLQQQCNLDQLFSPSCPGYGIAYAKTTILGPIASNASGARSTASAPSPMAEQGPASSNGSTAGGNGPMAGGAPGGDGPMTGGAPSGGGPGGSSNGPTAGGNGPMAGGAPGGGSTGGGGPGGSNNGPATGGGGAKSNVSTSQVLSMISGNAAKENSIAMSAANTATAQAIEAGNQTTRDAEATASTSAVQSSSASQTNGSNQTTVLVATANAAFGGGIKLPGMLNLGPTVNSGESDSSTPSAAGSSTTFNLRQELAKLSEVEILEPQEELKSNGLNPRLTTSTNIPAQIAPSEQRTDTVKKNTPDSSVAGEVSIAAMATQPAGYSAYSVTMPDASFYTPKEIYRNQKVVDNQRLMRGLTRGSDSLHEQMMEQQYPITK